MIKILQMCESLGLGGTQKVMQIISKYLDKSLFDVQVVGFYTGGERQQIIQDMGINVSVFDGDYDKFKDFLSKNDFDILHFHRSKMDSINLYKKIKDDFPKLKIIETNVFGRLTSLDEDNFVDYRIFVSQFCAMRFSKHYNIDYNKFFENNGVFYNLVDFDEWQKLDKQQIDEYKKSIGLHDDEILIGRIGRNDAYKFGDLCIDMMPYLVAKLSNIKYLIIGMPNEKLQKIQKLGLEKYFIIKEPSSDLHQLNLFYQSIDLLVHTSFIGESFGNVYAEAMANGKAIVTNSTPAKDNAQIEVVQDGINGLIGVYPQDFADKVYQLLTDKIMLNQIEANNLIRAQDFDARFWADYYQKLYIDILEGKIGNYFFTPDKLKVFEKVYSIKIMQLHSTKNYIYEAKLYRYRLLRKLRSILGK